jgi:hypothetical protein
VHRSQIVLGIVVIALLATLAATLATCVIPPPLEVSDTPDGGNTSRPNITMTQPPQQPGGFTLKATEQKEISATIEDTDAEDEITVRFFRDYDAAHPTQALVSIPATRTGATLPTYTATTQPFAWCVGLDPTKPHEILIYASDRGFDDSDGQFTTPRPNGLTSHLSLTFSCSSQ